MLAVHSLGVRVITVDTTSLFLVGFLLLCPWLAALKRIKIGDFEAEIDPAEVKRLTADIARHFQNSSRKPLLRRWGHLPREKPRGSWRSAIRFSHLPSSASNWNGRCAAFTPEPVSPHHLRGMSHSVGSSRTWQRMRRCLRT